MYRLAATSVALAALLASSCVSATASYQAPTVVLATPEDCVQAMDRAQVWIARFGPENGVTGLQSATPVVVSTARPQSDTSAEVFVDVTRTNHPDGSCTVEVAANSWNPFSVNRALRVESAIASALRTP